MDIDGLAVTLRAGSLRFSRDMFLDVPADLMLPIAGAALTAAVLRHSAAAWRPRARILWISHQKEGHS